MALAVKQSEKSRQTDLKVAYSASKAVRSVGIDQMALTRVAADAGFSSGAIYARCDDRSELVVLAWEKSFWPMLREILEALIAAVSTSSNDDLARLEDLLNAATDPDVIPDLGSAMEVIVAGRRDEVIAEVVHRDILALMDDHGVGASTDGPRRQAVVAGMAMIFGASLLNSAYEVPGLGPIDPMPLLRVFSSTSATPTKPAKAHGPMTPVSPVPFPTTHDEVRDALIAATEYVIARSGVHKATVSRIARRAGVSVGAIYGLYENKEALVGDCLDVLFPPQAKRDTTRWVSVFTATDQRAEITSILADYMSPHLEQWRRFRLECLVAARHSPSVAKRLLRYASMARESLLEAAMRAPATASIRIDTGIPARATVIGLGIVDIIDPTVSRLDWRWLPVR